MDFDVAKENIQPLAAGRNVSILQATLCADSPQELQLQRQKMEDAIHSYEGADPLEPWYAYISWLEQSFPSGGKESGLHEVMSKCLIRFETDERYFQDRRMAKLLIKHIDSMKDPTECYQQLYNAGIGTMVADFYICWAYYYDKSGNARKADEIFHLGIACHAQPLEELREAHQHFGFTVAQRMLYQDDEGAKANANQQLHERRLALTSLRGQSHKAKVGSIRTGAAVRSVRPGTVQLINASSSGRNSVQVPVFKDENVPTPDTIGAAIAEAVRKPASAIRSLVDSARNEENEKEPGPWNNAHNKNKSGKLFSNKARHKGLCFNIHADDEADQEDAEKKPLDPPIIVEVDNLNKPFKYPATFYARNLPQRPWVTPVTFENEPDANTLPQYNKCYLYPRWNEEFSPEELCAYRRFKRLGVTNEFTEKMDALWSKHDVTAGVRQYPNFAKRSRPQVRDALDAYYEPAKMTGLTVPFNKLYDSNQKEEFSTEELYARNMQRNATITKCIDMEETIVIPSENIQRRKSFFPTRLSLAPKAMTQCRSIVENEPIPQPNKTQSKAIIVADQEMPTTSGSIYSNKETRMDLRESHKSPNTPKPNLATDFENCTLNLKASESKKQEERTVMKTAVAIEISEDTTKHTNKKEHNAELPAKDTRPKNVEVIDKDRIQNTSSEQDPMVSRPFEIYEDETKDIIRPAAKDNGNPSDNYSFKVPITQPSGEKINRKIVEQHYESNPEVPVGTSEKELNPIKTFVPFEIYEDTTNTKIVLPTKSSIENPANSYFKAPAARSTAKSSKAPFEEHVETTVTPRPGALFDADETCSTQVFNAFLKSQPMSTPKAPLKVRPRQFGTELTEPVVDAAQIDQMEDEEVSPIPARPLYNACGHIDAAGAPTSTATVAPPSYSPGKKQLSTILETSEHGSTHGTHTTGASTKSTFSSPEMEGDVCVISTRITMPRTELETVEEQSSEFSSSKIDNNSKVLPSQLITPSIQRIQKVADTNMRSFQDYGKPHLQVGDFTRLEECEDTTSTYAHLPSIRFQDDKTETVPKIVPAKFQEDKTETISKILFEENKTGAIPKATNLRPPLKHAEAMDDSFDFLIKTPPNANRSKLKDLSQRSFFQPNAGKFQFADVLLSPKNSSTRCKSIGKPSDECFENVTKNDSLGFKNITFPKFESVVLDNITENFETNPLKKTKNESDIFKNLGFNSKNLTKDEPKGLVNNNMTKSPVKDLSMDIRKLAISSYGCESATKDESMGLENLGSPCFLSASKASSSGAQSDKQLLSLQEESQGCNKKAAHRSQALEKLPEQSLVQEKPTSEPFFELNAETEMFAPNSSKIKNSTWLPYHEPVDLKNKLNGKQPPMELSLKAPSILIETENSYTSATNISNKSNRNTSNAELQKKAEPCLSSVLPTQRNVLDVDEMSIYYKKTPRTPDISLDDWHSSESESDSYLPPASDADATQEILEQSLVDLNVNPFNPALKIAFLDNIDFTHYLQSLCACEFVQKLPNLARTSQVRVHDTLFEITKPIGKGAYGVIFSGLNKKTGQKCALKQERPPNYWEYYICLEVQSRIKAEEMLSAYMSIDFALIGHNASIFISPLSPYGSLIDVCNKVKKRSNKNVDEYVVMWLTCELLEIIDHLHAVGIIHADIKADNFLLMRRLSYESKERALQLIDFGVSIDLQQFKPGQTFNYSNSDEDFKCVEMREGRRWSYQIDLYGLAGVIHALLFGKYMEIEKRGCVWQHKTHVPRYFRKQLWDNIFQSLLNVRDQHSMPNLQQLRSLLKTELAEKEGYVLRKIAEFNAALY